MPGTFTLLRLLYCVLTADAGDMKIINVSQCGMEGCFLPASIIARLPHLDELHCSSQCRYPPLGVCDGGIEPIKKFFLSPEPKDLEGVAVFITSLLDSSSATVVPSFISVIEALLNQGQEHAPPMAQQLWVSLVSHKNSNEFVPLVEKFLDEYLDVLSDVMKWKDHSGRTAEATALTSCKRAMSSRSFFMGLYVIPDGLQHEYKSATCTVYIVDRVDDGKKTRVALKFMKNADEFEREKTSRQMLLASASGQAQTSQDYIIDTTGSHDCTDAAFCAAVQKRRWLVDYDSPCLLVMPAADRNLRIIMDNERITESSVIKTMFQEILNCVKFMHERSYIHGDLKPRNLMRVLHDRMRRIMLIDLDASAAIGVQYSWSKYSSAYLPPEALRLSSSLICSDFAVDDASSAAQCTLSFKFDLPFEISSGSAFKISIAALKVTAVQRLTLDAAVDLSSCISVKDHVITVTAKDALGLGDRRFKVVATFDGNLPAADSMSARLEHVVNTLQPMEGASKRIVLDNLAKCTVTIRNPLKESISKQPSQQLSSLNAPSEHTQLRPESSSRPLQLPPSVKQRPSVVPPSAPACPPRLSESAIASTFPKLLPLQDGLLSPAVFETASVMQKEYTNTVVRAQSLMRSARDAWITWQQISSRISGMHQSTQYSASDDVSSAFASEHARDFRSSVEADASANQSIDSSIFLQHADHGIAPNVPCECTCDKFLPPGMRSKDVCTGLCGLAHVSHDMWALGVILYRFCARRSLWSEDDEDNIKDDAGHLLELALWTDAFKLERLQKIEDTATRKLVSKLLEKEPWKRPRSIDDVLAMPFNEMEVIRLKLQQTDALDASQSQSSNLVGNVQDLVNLRTGKFSDAAFGLRPYLKVSGDWNEEAACTLQGMQDEVELLKDCPDCAQVQADALKRLQRSEADATLELHKLLVELKEQRSDRTQTKVAATAEKVRALRSRIDAAKGWYYGMPNSIKWKDEDVQVKYDTFTKVFSQPMCGACKKYNLDYSSIFADLHYITEEVAVEKQEWNGIRDQGRAGRRLQDYMALPQAQSAQLLIAELAALRFYTSHSFNSINIPMRDMDRKTPHPLPGMVTNIQRGLKKLRALGSDEASSKQTVVLWRGMSYMQLPQQFNAEGGTELAPMSTTTDVSVAISYAVKKGTLSALLFRFVTRNNLERGADVQWLSMFPGESETLFPPLTFLQKTRTEPQEVVHNGVKVKVVELSTTLA